MSDKAIESIIGGVIVVIMLLCIFRPWSRDE